MTKKKLAVFSFTTLTIVITSVFSYFTFFQNFWSNSDDSTETGGLSHLTCDGVPGGPCDTRAGWIGGPQPNYRVYGISDEDRNPDIPETYQIIGFNLSYLGADHDPVAGLTQSTYDEAKKVPDYAPQYFKAGVLYYNNDFGSAEKTRTIVLEDLKNEKAIRKHLYLGLRTSEIAEIEKTNYLQFEQAPKGATVSEFTKIFSEVWVDKNWMPEAYKQNIYYIETPMLNDPLRVGVYFSDEAPRELLDAVEKISPFVKTYRNGKPETGAMVNYVLDVSDRTDSSLSGISLQNGRYADPSPHTGGALIVSNT